MKLKEILSEFESALREGGFESAPLEASILLADSLGLPLGELPLKGGAHIPEAKLAKLRELLARRLAHEPLQYISGTAYFRFLKLKVGPGCLIPRPETELLAEIVMSFAPKGGSVCELGAGSGALGLSIAAERPDLRVYASEISPEAFAWAERNSLALSLPNYSLKLGDLLSPFSGQLFDAIAANLPYIPSGEMHSLPRDVRLREPSLALDGGPDGLDVIRRALAQCGSFLKPGGLFALEIGEEQGALALSLLESSGVFGGVELRKDLCGKDRFAIAVFTSC